MDLLWKKLKIYTRTFIHKDLNIMKEREREYYYLKYLKYIDELHNDPKNKITKNRPLPKNLKIWNPSMEKFEYNQQKGKGKGNINT